MQELHKLSLSNRGVGRDARMAYLDKQLADWQQKLNQIA